MVYLKIYTIPFLLLLTASFGQTSDDLKTGIWLNTITKNKIEKPLSNEAFHAANAGYALYFTKVDSLRVPYLVYVPASYNPALSHPLIIFLHGGVTGIDDFKYNSSSVMGEPIFSVADKYNAIILYPFGKRDFGWVKQQKAFENVITIINETEQRYNIDKQNIFLGGMSDGASAAFWFITNKPQLFKAFYAISPYPKILAGAINYQNITADKLLYSINAKDDEVFPFAKVKAIYESHKTEAPGWHFDSVTTGNHGFIYEDTGMVIINHLFNTLLNNAASKRGGVLDSLIQQLHLIDEADQYYRNQMDDIQSRYGGGSEQMKALDKQIGEADSINLVKVKAIIDKYGWLGADEIGSEGNSTLFMVIQHSNIRTQEQYLPLMKEAVKNGKAKSNELALLEDRVAVTEGKKQTYGSQLKWNMKNNTYTLLPLADPDNVDKRRAEVGLGSLSEYLSFFGLTWNVDQYKKILLQQKQN